MQAGIAGAINGAIGNDIGMAGRVWIDARQDMGRFADVQGGLNRPVPAAVDAAIEAGIGGIEE